MAHVAPTSPAPTLATPILHRTRVGGGTEEETEGRGESKRGIRCGKNEK